MTHKDIVNACESLGLKVIAVHDSGRRSFNAYFKLGRVYWSTSYEGGLLGKPRVINSGVDTDARSAEEIIYLVKLDR